MLTHGACAAAVDPGDATPVLAYLQQHRLTLCGILVTHHHDDHIGGIESILRHCDAPVFAPRGEHFSFAHRPVAEGDTINLAELETALDVLDIPGHTGGHVAYYGGNSLFCGDTLFGCGCGRVFDSDCRQLHRSLQKLARLPDETEIYCAHEYTLANLRFARLVDPDNPLLLERERRDAARAAQGLPTLPSTLGLEKATNPFLRCHTPAIQFAAGLSHTQAPNAEETAFFLLREFKNNYKS